MTTKKLQDVFASMTDAQAAVAYDLLTSAQAVTLKPVVEDLNSVMASLAEPMKPSAALLDLSEKYGEISERYQQDVRTFINSAPLNMKDDEFFGLIDALNEQIQKAVERNGIRHGVSAGIEEFIRSNVVDHGEKQMEANWTRMARFLRYYKSIVIRLDKKVGDFQDLDMGDDSFGDLLDLLALAGEEIVTAILQNGIGSMKELRAELKLRSRGQAVSPGRLILEGEHYVRSTLEDKLNGLFRTVFK